MQPLPGGGAVHVTLTSVFLTDDIWVMAFGQWLLYCALSVSIKVKFPKFLYLRIPFSKGERRLQLGSITNVKLLNASR